jgi:hypothetical protein
MEQTQRWRGEANIMYARNQLWAGLWILDRDPTPAETGDGKNHVVQAEMLGFNSLHLITLCYVTSWGCTVEVR